MVTLLGHVEGNHVQSVVLHLLEHPNYPRKQVRKRKRVEEEADEAPASSAKQIKIDYASADRPRPTGENYANLSLVITLFFIFVRGKLTSYQGSTLERFPSHSDTLCSESVYHTQLFVRAYISCSKGRHVTETASLPPEDHCDALQRQRHGSRRRPREGERVDPEAGY